MKFPYLNPVFSIPIPAHCERDVTNLRFLFSFPAPLWLETTRLRRQRFCGGKTRNGVSTSGEFPICFVDGRAGSLPRGADVFPQQERRKKKAAERLDRQRCSFADRNRANHG
jgi:hypothetical protein